MNLTVLFCYYDAMSKNLTLQEISAGLAKIQQSDDLDINKIVTKFRTLLDKTRTPQENRELALVLEKISMYEDNGAYAISKTVPSAYKPLAKKLIKQLVTDYVPNNNYQLHLINMAVIAYLKYIVASEKYSNFLEMSSIDKTVIDYYSQISQDIDRSLNQYSTLITKLGYISQQKANIQVQVNSVNTYIGKNQKIRSKIDSNAKCTI